MSRQGSPVQIRSSSPLCAVFLCSISLTFYTHSMELLRLSTLPRGRPKHTPKPKAHTTNQPAVLSLMYKARRITHSQLQNAIAFRRFASRVYSTSGGPVAANNTGVNRPPGNPSNNTEHKVDFDLWRVLVYKIELACGRRGVDLLVDVLFEDQDVPGLIADTSIDVSTINTFRRALEVVGSVLC